MALAGTLYVQIKPSLEGFAEELRAKLAEANNDFIVNVKPSLDSTAMDKVRAQLDALSAKTSTPKVDLGGAAKMAAEIEALKAQIDSLNGKKVNIDTSASISRIGLLSLAIAGLGPALIPIAAVGTAALGSMGIAAGIAAGAIGTIGLAFSGMGPAIKAQDALTKAVQEYGAGSTQAVTATKNLDAAMRNLSPAAQSFVNFYHSSLKPVLDQMKAAAAAGLLPGLQAGIQTALPALTQLTSFIGIVAKAMGDLAREAGAALTSPFWHQFFDFVNSVAAPTIKGLGEAFGNFIKGIAGLMQALFVPVFQPMLKWLQDFAKTVADFGTSAAAGTNGPFNTFLRYVKDAAPVVTEFLKAFVQAIQHIVEAMAGQGLATLSVLTDLMKIIAALPLPVIQALIDLFIAYQAIKLASSVVTDLRTTLSLLGEGGIGGALKKIGDSGGLYKVLGIGAAIAGMTLLADKFLPKDTGNDITDHWRGEISGLAEALKDPPKAMDDMKRQFDEFGGDGPHSFNQGPLMKWFRGLPTEIAGAWQGVQQQNGKGLDVLTGDFKDKWKLITDWWNSPTGSASFFGTWKPLWDKLQPVLESAWEANKIAMQKEWGWFTDFFSGPTGTSLLLGAWKSLWDQFGPILSHSWDGIKTDAVNKWNGITDFFSGPTGFSLLTGAWTTLWSGLSPILATWWQDYLTSVTTWWGRITGFFEGPTGHAAFTGAWSTFWSGLSPVLVQWWQDYLTNVTTWWGRIMDFFNGPSGHAAFTGAWTTFWSGLSPILATWWQDFLTGVSTWWGKIMSFFDGPTGHTLFTGAWTKMWSDTNVETGVGGGTVATGVTSWWQSITSWFSGPSGTSVFLGAWKGLWDGVKTLADSLLPGVATAVKNGINVVIGVINGMIHGINTVLGIVHIPITIGDIPLLASGGALSFPNLGFAQGGELPSRIGPGFVTSGPMAVVGEGNPSHPEYVIPTDPIYRPRARALYDDLGGQLMAEGGILPRMAGGGVLSDVASWLGGGAASLAASVIGQAEGASPITFIGGIAGGAMKMVIDALAKQVEDAWNALQAALAAAAAAALNLFGGAGGPAGAGAIGGWVSQALAILGWPASYGAGMAHQVRTESGGNPTAQNNTDSNARAGHPSKGVAQTIDSTFAAYALPGYGDIWNPVDNIIAGMRYAMARYGPSWFADGPWHDHGYDEGGVANESGLIPKLTNQPERVLSPLQTQDFHRLVDWLASTRSGAVGLDFGGTTTGVAEMRDELRQIRLMLKRNGAGVTQNIYGQSTDPGEIARASVLHMRLA